MSVEGLSIKKANKYELGKKTSQLAHEYDLQYGRCAQCVLAAIQETIGVVSDDVIKAAAIFSGGSGLVGIGTCGALAGGLAALSCKYGTDRKKLGKNQSTKNLLKGRLLIKRFETEYGGISCNDIQKKFTGRTYDMWNANEAKEFKEKHYDKICPKVCGNVAKWVVALI